jgi:hypothetical protein
MDTTWTAGYVTEVEYTHGYYRELSPGILRLACLAAGVVPPKAQDLSYLELGFGQGLSINIHSAAVPGTFWGTDFNPVHAGHARAMAEASGSGARLLDDSFAELAERSDLPDFDMICLHGIWTWISHENRKVIVDIIRRKLKVGGIVYNSYNCFPGWAPAVPLRHLMKLHGQLAGADATGIVARLDGALAFVQKVIDSGALYFRGNPQIQERLKRLKEMNRNYLAHEYFTADWELMTFSEMAEWLEPAKLSFVASGHILDHVDVVNLTPDGRKLLADIHHPILKQTVRDYFVNQQFRRDIFMKGPNRFTPLDHTEALRSQMFMLVGNPAEIPMKVTGSLGEADLNEKVYRPLLEALARGNHAPKTLAQLHEDPKLKGMSFGTLVQDVLALVGASHVWPVQQPSADTRKHCKALNRYLCERARSSSDVTYLASPVIGGGVAVSSVEQLLLLSSMEGGKSPGEQAGFAWKLLQQQGKRVIKDGKAVETADDNVSELNRLATEFASKRLPILRPLEVA